MRKVKLPDELESAKSLQANPDLGQVQHLPNYLAQVLIQQLNGLYGQKN